MDGSAARAEPYFEVMRPPGEIGIEPVDLVRERFEDFKALKHGFESRARFHPREIIAERSEEHTSELQSLMRISYAVFCLKKKKKHEQIDHENEDNQHENHNNLIHQNIQN